MNTKGKRLWLLLPLAVHLLSMLLPTLVPHRSMMVGWEVWLTSWSAPLEGEPGLVFLLGDAANFLFLAALPILFVSRSERWPGIVGSGVALGSLLAAIPIAMFLPSLLTLPGFWVWALSFFLLAAPGYLRLARAPSSESKRTELRRAGVLATLPAVVLCSLLLPAADSLATLSFQVVSTSAAVAITVCGVSWLGALGWRVTLLPRLIERRAIAEAARPA